MGKKVLFAVMALLTMATGLRADNTAYVVYDGIETLYFLSDGDDNLSVIEIGGKNINLITSGDDQNCWKGDNVTNTSIDENPGWQKNSDIRKNVKKVVFEESFGLVSPKSCYGWFNWFQNLQNIDGLKYLNTSQVIIMTYMFKDCNSLTSLDLSNFDTSNVIKTYAMFQNCYALTSLDLSSFNTSNVEVMDLMFEGCKALTSLTFGDKFYTSKVVDGMYGMFRDCQNLTSLDLSNFDTSNLTQMGNMFKNCYALSSLDISNFSTQNRDKFDDDLFNNCNSKNFFLFVSPEHEKDKILNNLNPTYTIVKNKDTGNFEYDGDVEINSDDYEDSPLIILQEFTAKSVKFTRTFEANKPYTICLPFAIDITEIDGKFYEYSRYDKDNGKVIFARVKETEKTEPNKPYLFIPNEEVTEITAAAGTEDANSVTISSTRSNLSYGDDDCSFIGVYEKKTFTEEELNAGEYDYYGWTSDIDVNDGFRKAGKDASVDPCRAYIKLSKKTTGNNAPACLSIQLGGDTTGITSAESGDLGGEEAPVYNLQGQRVGSNYKGVVIKNGKKMIMK